MDQRVEKIQQLMRDNLHREISLNELANSVNLSVWRIGHIFTSDVGMSPIKYLRLLRMERARYLLETSYLSIKEIGFYVGLKDESHFVRDFKKVYGAAPTEYRMRFYAGGPNGFKGKNLVDIRVRMAQRAARTAQVGAFVLLNLLSYSASCAEVFV